MNVGAILCDCPKLPKWRNAYGDRKINYYPLVGASLVGARILPYRLAKSYFCQYFNVNQKINHGYNNIEIILFFINPKQKEKYYEKQKRK
jgi:hypothetical protein